MKLLTLISAGLLALASASTVPEALEGRIDAMQKAKHPSAVIAHFAAALAVDKDSPELHEAYTRRMAELGLPDLALTQAERLVELKPESGLGWAIIALADAQYEDTFFDAVETMRRAAELAGEDEFVRFAAGQLMALYDSEPLDPDAPEEAIIAAVQLRAILGETDAFRQGYDLAWEAIADARAADELAPPDEPGTVDVYTTTPSAGTVQEGRDAKGAIVYRSYTTGPAAYSVYDYEIHSYYASPPLFPMNVYVYPARRCYVPIHGRHDGRRHDEPHPGRAFRLFGPSPRFGPAPRGRAARNRHEERRDVRRFGGSWDRGRDEHRRGDGEWRRPREERRDDAPRRADPGDRRDRGPGRGPRSEASPPPQQQDKLAARREQTEAERQTRRIEQDAQQAQRQAEAAAKREQQRVEGAARQAERQAAEQAKQAQRQAEQQARRVAEAVKHQQQQVEAAARQAERQAAEQAKQAQRQAEQAAREAERRAQQEPKRIETQARKEARREVKQENREEKQTRREERREEKQTRREERRAQR